MAKEHTTMMRFMITGGNQGLGFKLTEHYAADSYSRINGFNIVTNTQRIADISLNYDVFINNAYEGLDTDTNLEFAQAKLLHHVAMLWKQHSKAGYIINIGGAPAEDIISPPEGWETYGVNKAALKYHSRQWSRAFRNHDVPFKTSLITVDRLDTPLGRTTETWTGNGHDLSNVVDMVDLCLNVASNTCIEEITAWVDLQYK